MMLISREAMSRGGSSRSRKKMQQLRCARGGRGIALIRRTPPARFRSVELFLTQLRAFCLEHRLGRELARYCQVNECVVRRWLRGTKQPLQYRLVQMAEFYKANGGERKPA